MPSVKQTIFLFIYVVYGVSGVYGALRISDEFDVQRLYFYAFFAVPVSVLFLYGLLSFPDYWAEKQSLKKTILICLFLSQSWGNFLLFNAISKSSPVVYSRLTKTRVEQRSMRIAYRRGGLGWLYRMRW